MKRTAYKREWNRLNKIKRAIYMANLYATNEEFRQRQLERSRKQYERIKERKANEESKQSS